MMPTKFATYPLSRSSASSSKLVRMLKRISPKSRPKLPAERKYVIQGPSIVTQEQAIADTKILMDFYRANAEWDMERHRRRRGVVDFSKLH